MDDIDEAVETRRVHEAKSAEWRAKYLDAIEEIPGLYVCTNLKGIVRQANALASEALGCSPVDKPLIGFVARRDTHGFRVLLGDLAARRSATVSAALCLRRRGGPVFEVRLTGRLVSGSDGRAVALRWLALPVE